MQNRTKCRKRWIWTPTRETDTTWPSVPSLETRRRATAHWTRVERAIDWLAQRIDDKAGALEARRTRETAATDAWDLLQKEKKEQRVFRKVLRKAHPQEGEPEECMDESEGLEFFASELGCTIEDMDPTAKRLAALMNYQKLALQMTAAMNQPVNPKEARAHGLARRGGLRRSSQFRKWDPAVVQSDEDEDPTSMKNRMAKRGLVTRDYLRGGNHIMDAAISMSRVLEHQGFVDGLPPCHRVERFFRERARVNSVCDPSSGRSSSQLSNARRKAAVF